MIYFFHFKTIARHASTIEEGAFGAMKKNQIKKVCSCA